MIEQTYVYSTGNKTEIEMLVQDPTVRINHMILAPGEAIPAHPTSSKAFLVVTDGVLGLTLDAQEQHKYAKGGIIQIPANTSLGLISLGDEPMRLFVVKSEAC
jgi:quercetin dioxygenase-like cupin family protein